MTETKTGSGCLRHLTYRVMLRVLFSVTDIVFHIIRQTTIARLLDQLAAVCATVLHYINGEMNRRLTAGPLTRT